MPTRLLSLLIALLLSGCVTAAKREARAKTVQLQPGMTQAAVVKIFGQPSRTELKPATDFMNASVWTMLGPGGRSTEQLIWKYDQADLEVRFENSNRGLVVVSWEAD